MYSGVCEIEGMLTPAAVVCRGMFNQRTLGATASRLRPPTAPSSSTPSRATPQAGAAGNMSASKLPLPKLRLGSPVRRPGVLAAQVWLVVLYLGGWLPPSAARCLSSNQSLAPLVAGSVAQQRQPDPKHSAHPLPGAAPRAGVWRRLQGRQLTRGPAGAGGAGEGAPLAVARDRALRTVQCKGC